MAEPGRRSPAGAILLVSYLLVAGVALRSADYFGRAGPRGWIAAGLLALYLAVLTWDQLRQPRPGGHGYLLLQTGIAAAAMLLAHEQDYYACLFFPLSTQALLYLPRRAGIVWIVIFSAIFV